ncbi:MAG: ribonuclease HII [Euryarchaeota archaeon]|nr:ribonuclease HII [Euryarchaeota archaeon]
MLCGVDEAGRGPVMGPLVVAAVAVEDDAALVALKVRDSKKLSGKRREELAPQIRKIARVESIAVEASQIDALRGEMTMNDIEARVFASVIDRIKPDIVYLDAADVRAEFYGAEVGRRLSYKPSKIVSEHEADARYPVVSAASIIAKTERDAAMRKIAADIGEKIGSGYPSDPVTRGFLERYMASHGDLPPHTRRSWETAQDIAQGQKVLKLDSFMRRDGRA